MALSDNRAGFETHAEALHGQLRGQGPEWQQVVEMGREIAPEHPFFSADEASDEAFASAEEETFDLSALSDDLPAVEDDEFDAELEAEAFVEPATESKPKAGADSLDFDLDAGELEEPVAADAISDEANEDDELSLDFDIDAARDAVAAEPESERQAYESDDALEFESSFLNEELAETSEEEAVAGPTTDDELHLDFDLPEDLEPTRAEATPDEAIEDQPQLSDSDNVFDLGDEVATKLDLARAYLDMGDEEGARSLLDEVLEEGSDSQRAEAETLLKKAS
ncbi:FimV/HubP family polar landmark protein [Alkalilimnicola ehrlichii]|nr:FimV/HubP family polar landmark protein [Alkalilimnicola ehrlichii]